MKTRNNIGPLKVGQDLISEDYKMASTLDDFFCTVFSTEDTSN